MLRRLSFVKLAVIPAACVLSLAVFSVPENSHGESWETPTRTVAKAKKKKKTPKRLKASNSANGRLQASSGLHVRYLAQDLDSDLESDLDAELGTPDESAKPEAAEKSPVATATGEDVQILDIQYDSKKDGGTVVISTTGAATYRTREVPSQNQVVVEIANAKLPDRLKRPFNTKDFKQSIISLNAYQESGSGTARIVLQFRQPRSVDVRQNGKVLTVNAVAPGAVAKNSKSSDNGESAANSAPPAAKSEDFGGSADEEMAENAALDDESAEASTGGESSPGTGRKRSASAESASTETNDEPVDRSMSRRSGPAKILPSSTLEQERLGDVRFYGKAISIEVRETPVRDVITLISDQSGANIIMSDDVQGSITIKLRQVPWDQALSIIMKTRGLGYVRQNGVLRIAPLRQLQAEIEEARRILDAQESTLPLRVKVIPVSFANVTALATQVRATLQGATSSAATGGAVTAMGRGRIEPDPRTSSVVVTDTDDNVKRIEQLIKALDTPPLQVMIEGKIVEAKESATRSLGINWGYQGQDLAFAGGTLSHTAQINPTLGASNTTLDLKLGTLDFLGDLNAKLALFESEQVAKIISSPRVITMNAQKATISQSVNIPVTTTTLQTGSTPATTSTDFKPIPTTLSVTPQITSGGDVLMQIKFDRSFQAGSGGANVAIDSRTVDTNVMVKNGQTTVIGGIYQSDETEQEGGTPFLRKIPVLGWLFKSTTKSSIRNELLVFITPRILNADRNLPKSGIVQ